MRSKNTDIKIAYVAGRLGYAIFFEADQPFVIYMDDVSIPSQSNALFATQILQSGVEISKVTYKSFNELQCKIKEAFKRQEALTMALELMDQQLPDDYREAVVDLLLEELRIAPSLLAFITNRFLSTALPSDFEPSLAVEILANEHLGLKDLYVSLHKKTTLFALFHKIICTRLDIQNVRLEGFPTTAEDALDAILTDNGTYANITHALSEQSFEKFRSAIKDVLKAVKQLGLKSDHLSVEDIRMELKRNGVVLYSRKGLLSTCIEIVNRLRTYLSVNPKPILFSQNIKVKVFKIYYGLAAVLIVFIFVQYLINHAPSKSSRRTYAVKKTDKHIQERIVKSQHITNLTKKNYTPNPNKFKRNRFMDIAKNSDKNDSTNGTQQSTSKDRAMLQKRPVNINLTNLSLAPVITLDSPKIMFRGVFTEPSLDKYWGISVKGFITAPSGIKSVSINGIKIDLLDSIGSFKSYIYYTSPFIHIKAIAKNNAITDTIFKLINIKKNEKDNTVLKSNIDSNYLAIIIANSDYRGSRWNDLPKSIMQAEELTELLTARYNFLPQNIFTFYNEDGKIILKGMADILSKVTNKDNILIFYDGHSYENKLTQTYYWVPAKSTDNEGDISSLDIDKILSTSKAPNIVVIADACYGGMKRGSASDYANNFSTEFANRQLLISGNDEKGTADTSIFISSVIDALKKNEQPWLSISDIYSDILKTVSTESGKMPRLRSFQEGVNGEFYFKRNLKNSVYEKNSYSLKLKTRDSLIMLGQISIQAGNFAGALEEFKKAMDINPDSSNLVATYLWKNLRNVLSFRSSKPAQLYIDSAIQSESAGGYEVAYLYYSKAIHANQIENLNLNDKISQLQNKIDVFNKVNDYLALKTFNDALKICDAMIAINSGDLDYLYLRTKVYQAMGIRQKALADLKVVFELQPENKNALHDVIALTKVDKRENSEIEKLTIDSTIRLNPNYAEAYLARGALNQQIGDYAKALNDYQIYIKHLKAPDSRVLNKIGEIYELEAVYDSAFRYYERSFKEDSSNANARAVYGMASVFYLKGLKNYSFPLFEKAFSMGLIKEILEYDRNIELFWKDVTFKSLFNKYYD